MFGIFKKKKQIAIWETDFDDIWKIEDKNHFLIAMNGWICKKCNYGDDIEKLTAAEKSFYLVFQLEGEVNNGGFSQFFFNHSGKYANELEAALVEIGANNMAEIFRNLLFALKQEIPTNWEERAKMISDLPDGFDNIFTQYDNEFYNYPDNLEELSYQFIQRNRKQFLRT